MEDPAISAKVSQELALRDLSDIVALRKSDAFNRYFLRRLATKKADAEKRLKYDPPAKLDVVQREQMRLLFLAYEELEKMLDTDEGAIRAQFGRS